MAEYGRGGSEGVFGPLTEWLRTYAQAAGLFFVVLAGGVLVLTFPFRYTHTIMVEGLVPVFGSPFAFAFLALQAGVMAVLRSWKGLAVVLGLFGLGALLGWTGMNWALGYQDVEVEGFTAARHVLCSGAVAGGLGAGIGLMRGRLVPRR